MWYLVLLLTYVVKATIACDLACLNREIYQNVTEIASSGQFHLTENLVLERLDGRDGIVDEVDKEVSSEMLLKRVGQLFDTHRLKYRLVNGLELAVFKQDGRHLALALLSGETPAARTFGVHVFRKRMMYILLAMTFKLGIMTTLLVTILVLVLKGLKIGVLLLMLTFASVFSRWRGHGHVSAAYEDKAKPQGVHVHLHSTAAQFEAQKQAYSAWVPEKQEYAGWVEPQKHGWLPEPIPIPGYNRRNAYKPPVYPVDDGSYQVDTQQ